MKWEYKIISSALDDDKEEAALARWGNLGWEMVTAYGHRIYLKRPLLPKLPFMETTEDDLRTVEQVKQQRASVTGCCNRHCDNQACDCLERAIVREDRARKHHH